ncbi:MAG: ABC transporter ATP-binding protein [Verrucomicrobiota bacterium]|nr:ABC transporter ATP-binding protein [Verrucomicrobiota bacterium]
MSEPVIRVEQLSKRYILAHKNEGQQGLRHVLTDMLSRPFSRNKEKSFNETEEFWALKDVSFEVHRGDVLGIIGRNGAGKSTLLKCLSRITEPSSGRITLRGRVASLLEVGTGFHPELTGRENIFLNGAILGMARVEIKQKFDEIVAFAEVERFIDTPVKRYSSGMYVRLAFAVAAHLEPEILIVDEVLAVGDAQFQKKCLGKMQEVSVQEGRTVLFVSHQLASVRRLCNRALLMERGTTTGVIGVEEAIQRYNQQGADVQCDINLKEARRPDTASGQARINRVRISEGSSFQYGSPLRLDFEIDAASALRNCTVGIGFDTLDGYRILTLDSDNSGGNISLSQGSQKVSFSIERNPLHPGAYSCGVAIMNGRQVVDFVPNCGVWEVQSSPNDTLSDRGFAGCRVPIEVSLETT